MRFSTKITQIKVGLSLNENENNTSVVVRVGSIVKRDRSWPALTTECVLAENILGIYKNFINYNNNRLRSERADDKNF